MRYLIAIALATLGCHANGTAPLLPPAIQVINNAYHDTLPTEIIVTDVTTNRIVYDAWLFPPARACAVLPNDQPFTVRIQRPTARVDDAQIPPLHPGDVWQVTIDSLSITSVSGGACWKL